MYREAKRGVHEYCKATSLIKCSQCQSYIMSRLPLACDHLGMDRESVDIIYDISRSFKCLTIQHGVVGKYYIAIGETVYMT